MRFTLKTALAVVVGVIALAIISGCASEAEEPSSAQTVTQIVTQTSPAPKRSQRRRRPRRPRRSRSKKKSRTRRLDKRTPAALPSPPRNRGFSRWADRRKLEFRASRRRTPSTRLTPSTLTGKRKLQVRRVLPRNRGILSLRPDRTAGVRRLHSQAGRVRRRSDRPLSGDSQDPNRQRSQLGERQSPSRCG